MTTPTIYIHMRSVLSALAAGALMTVASCSSVSGSSSTQAPATAGPVSAFAVIDEIASLSSQDLWPGFDARQMPMLLFDGQQTLLFNHPAPPAEFGEVPTRPGVRVVSGRHSAVTANSSTKVGGVETATVILRPTLTSARAGAALAMHEAFHVFQRRRHPQWAANEVDLFTYPITDTSLVTQERLEMDALWRALRSPGLEACWAGTAMRMRRHRFGELPAASVKYERGSELNEGLATYVENRAIALPDSLVFPADVFPPAAVRQRTYTSGHAIARLLDKLSPGWKSELEANDSLTLDSLLTRAVIQRGTFEPRAECDYDEVEQDAVLTSASEDVDSLRAEREHRRMSFMGQTGLTLVVSTATAPLWPQGFDPLNVHVLMEGEVLHTRYIKLGNDNGTLEVLDRASLTKSAGAHPMFNGLRTVTVAGIPRDSLKFTRSETGITARGAGIQLTVRQASVDTSGTTITVRLP